MLFNFRIGVCSIFKFFLYNFKKKKEVSEIRCYFVEIDVIFREDYERFKDGCKDEIDFLYGWVEI